MIAIKPPARGRVARLALLSVLLAAVALLAACSEEAAPATVPPTRTPKPTFTHTPPSTDTPVPTATLTALPTDTPTPPPTDTPTPVPPTSTPTVIPTDTPVPSPTRDPLVNPLNGLPVSDPAVLQRRPILVRYGNDAGAWPHAGISQAEVVYEDVMEAYWITRITAVFLAEQPEAVGPVRSARPINLATVPQYDGVFVYSGASTGVSQLLAQADFPKITEGISTAGFYRSAKKKSPHNLYTSVPALRKYLADKGLEKAVDLEGFVFAAEPPQGQPALKIHIPYPRTSIVDYSYNADKGLYMRFVQGEPYLEELTGQQIGMANVVVQYVAHEKTDIVEDSLGSTAINIVTIGEGRVQIFRDGRVIEGTWKRAQITDFPQYLDAQGNPIPLKPGSTWVQFVPPDYQLTISGQ